MRKIPFIFLALLLAALMWACAPAEVVVVQTPEPTPEPTPRPVVVLEYRDPGAEAWIWETLNGYTGDELITAGIMGYFWRESCYRSDAVAGWTRAEAMTGTDPCLAFVETVDSGLADGSSREYFCKYARYKYGGFGLGQWSWPDSLERFYDFAQAWGTSIGDAEMQCAFVVHDIQTAMPELWAELQDCTTAREAGRLIAVWYDGTRTGVEAISAAASEIYDRRSDNVREK